MSAIFVSFNALQANDSGIIVDNGKVILLGDTQTFNK
jgi:hypothetical protein